MINLPRKTSNEFPAIRQINVMRACVNRRTCHAIVLPLERPGTVDHYTGDKRPQPCRKVRRISIELGVRSIARCTANSKNFYLGIIG